MADNIVSPEQKISFWRKIFKALSYNQKFFWTSFWFIMGFFVMLIPVFCAGAINKILTAPALLWSFAYMLLGGLLGFVFGVPTIITSGSSASSLNRIAQSNDMVNPTTEKIVQANTNLTQISDWLTKVIVGAGLVELRKIPHFIIWVSGKMAKGLEVNVNTEAFAAVFSGGIIVLFSTYGFVFGYLIMRLILTELFAK